MNASADIQTQTNANVLSVPINAVTTRDKNDSTKTSAENSDVINSSTSTNDLEVVVFVLIQTIL